MRRNDVLWTILAIFSLVPGFSCSDTDDVFIMNSAYVHLVPNKAADSGSCTSNKNIQKEISVPYTDNYTGKSQSKPDDKNDEIPVNLVENRQNSLLDDLPPIDLDTNDQFRELRRVKRHFNADRNEEAAFENNENFESTVHEMIEMIDVQKNILKRIARDAKDHFLKTLDIDYGAHTAQFPSTIISQESNLTLPTNYTLLISNVSNPSNISKKKNFEALSNVTYSLPSIPAKQNADVTLPSDLATQTFNKTLLYNITDSISKPETNKHVDNNVNFSELTNPNRTQRPEEILDFLLSTSMNKADIQDNALEIKRSINSNEITDTTPSVILSTLNDATPISRNIQTEDITMSKVTSEHQQNAVTKSRPLNEISVNITISTLASHNLTTQSNLIDIMKNSLDKDENKTADINKTAPFLSSLNEFFLSQTNRETTVFVQGTKIPNTIQTMSTLVTGSNAPNPFIKNENHSFHFDISFTELNTKKNDEHNERTSEVQKEISTSTKRGETTAHQNESFEDLLQPTKHLNKTVITETFAEISTNNVEHTENEADGRVYLHVGTVMVDVPKTDKESSTINNKKPIILNLAEKVEISKNEAIIDKEKDIVNVTFTNETKNIDSIVSVPHDNREKYKPVANLDTFTYDDQISDNIESASHDIVRDWGRIRNPIQYETDKVITAGEKRGKLSDYLGCFRIALMVTIVVYVVMKLGQNLCQCRTKRRARQAQSVPGTNIVTFPLHAYRNY